MTATVSAHTTLRVSFDNPRLQYPLPTTVYLRHSMVGMRGGEHVLLRGVVDHNCKKLLNFTREELRFNGNGKGLQAMTDLIESRLFVI